MKLDVITWNINFIHDNWFERLDNINKILEREVENSDIIAIQEETLPFNNKIMELHSFLKNSNIKYFGDSLLERNYIYKYILEKFPKYKKYVYSTFEYLMNKLMWICAHIFSRWGEQIKSLYFKHPYICLILSICLAPIFAGMWWFIGLLTVVNKDIKTVVKSKCIGNRIIQYFDFKHNNKEIRCVNVHLPPGETDIAREKRSNEMKEIIEFCKNKKNVIIMGDFNDTRKSKMYKWLKKGGYKNSVYKVIGEDLNTFPCVKPIKCIDYIMIKGDIKITSASLFGNSKASDHKGIKVRLDV